MDTFFGYLLIGTVWQLNLDRELGISGRFLKSLLLSSAIVL
jgi:hypothetical protein